MRAVTNMQKVALRSLNFFLLQWMLGYIIKLVNTLLVLTPLAVAENQFFCSRMFEGRKSFDVLKYFQVRLA